MMGDVRVCGLRVGFVETIFKSARLEDVSGFWRC